MSSVNYFARVEGLGEAQNKQMTRTADGGDVRAIRVPHGFNGTLTTRTDGNTGVITLSPGHGIATGDKVDIYWAGGVQKNVTVGTVSTNSMPFDLGVGRDLPAATTAVVVTKQVDLAASIISSGLAFMSAQTVFDATSETAQSSIVFAENSTDITLTADDVRIFDVTGGDANPLNQDNDDTVNILGSTGSSTSDATITLIVLQDV